MPLKLLCACRTNGAHCSLLLLPAASRPRQGAAYIHTGQKGFWNNVKRWRQLEPSIVVAWTLQLVVPAACSAITQLTFF